MNIDLAARAPPMNKLVVIVDGLSVFAASDINVILSRMCSSLTCNCTKHFITKNVSSASVQQIEFSLTDIKVLF